MIFNDQTAGIICLSVGGAIGAFFIWTIFRRSSINKWSVTYGTVLDSRLNQTADSFEPYVKYSYEVGGKNYTNDRFYAVNYLSEDEKYSEKLIAPYSAGKSVPVYFNPQNPSDAVLEKRSTLFIDILWMVVTMCFIFVGVEFLL